MSNMDELRYNASRLNSLEDKLRRLVEFTPLKEVQPGTVLLVVDCSTTESAHGPMSVLRCGDPNGAGEPDMTIMDPIRYADESNPDAFPAMYVYLGMNKPKGKK